MFAARFHGCGVGVFFWCFHTIASVIALFVLPALVGCLPEPEAEPPKAAPAARPRPHIDEEEQAPGTIREKAEVGVGAKGHGYGQGLVSTPAGAFFRTKERLAFDIQIKHAMNLFKAMENRAPKSHEEFMEKIIRANHIALPELPEGHRYVYDPKTEELMVEKPAE